MKRTRAQILSIHARTRQHLEDVRAKPAFEQRKVRALERIIECQAALNFHPVQSDYRLRELTKAKRAFERLTRKEKAA